jgi:hypothetical protein
MKKTIQDVLSSVKTALTSDTGKAIGAGLAGVAAGALLGGEGGVQAVGALGSAVQNARERKKREEREAEDRDLRKLQKTKAELDLEASRENITGKRLDNIKKVFGDTVSSAFMPFGGKIGKSTTTATDKYGKISEHDVALEDKIGKVQQLVDPKITPAPLTGPESLMVEDEKQLQKNLEKIQASGAQHGAASVMKTGTAGYGKEFLRENRRKFAKELQAKGLNPTQESAAWREMQEQIAPGSIARAKEMLATEPEYTTKEAFAENWPAAVGSVAGGFIGAMPGIASLNIPLAIAGGSAGFTAGNYAGRAYDEWMAGQKDVTPTPAVAGADKTAADMAAYSMSLEAKMLLRSILKTASQPQDIPQIIQQLPQLADFKALPVGDQERVLIELERRIPRGPLPRIGPYYRTPQEQAAAQQPVNSLRDTINDMGQWATRKLGIGG